MALQPAYAWTARQPQLRPYIRRHFLSTPHCEKSCLFGRSMVGCEVAVRLRASNMRKWFIGTTGASFVVVELAAHRPDDALEEIRRKAKNGWVLLEWAGKAGESSFVRLDVICMIKPYTADGNKHRERNGGVSYSSRRHGFPPGIRHGDYDL
jgi:hypothetical protein